MLNTFTFHTTAEEVANVFASEIAGKNGIGLQLAEDALKKEIPAANIRKLILDLSSLAAVRVAAAEANAYPEPLHVLINNAAAAITPFKVTVDNLEKQMGTGHVGPFLFTNLLVPTLLAATSGTYTPRVVFISSIAHMFLAAIDFATLAQPNPAKYASSIEPYNETKGANVLTATELSRRSHGTLNAYSLHPGLIYTNQSQNPESLSAFQAYGILDDEGRPDSSVYAWKTIPEGAAT
ncbi:hypothetical protein B0H17DRAFT_1212817 [Mycena rosella]|uniref:Uncharacterized protein n=1 Tax=Mycena rosella TaxID=1033263 RepID=A0AAD7G657_MYCRO|nr:hypothetical protein B0H17DRAFT_1212817 [Mycena rosella]